LKNLNLNDFLEAESECATQTIFYLGEDLILYEHTFNLLLEMIHHICSRKTSGNPLSTVKSAIMIIVPRIIQSLQSIRDLTLKGYYYDLSVVQRSFIESIGLCAYLSQNPEEALNWLKGKDVSVAKINLLPYAGKLLKDTKTNTKRAKALYGRLCNYAHANVRAVASLLAKSESSNLTIGTFYVPVFDEKQVECIAPWSILTLAVLREIFYNELAERKRNKITKQLNLYLDEMDLILETKKSQLYGRRYR
jgi:hypothetical protein